MKFRMVIQTLGIALLAATVIWCLGFLANAAHPDWDKKTSAIAGQSKGDPVVHVSEDNPNINKHQGQAKAQGSKGPNEPADPQHPDTDSTGDAVQSAADQMEVLWPGAAPQDYDLINPPEIEPLYVRAFTEIVAGHNDSNPIWSPSGKLIAFERSIEDKREIIISRFDGLVLQKIYHRLSEEDTEMDFLFADILDDVSYNAGISWAPDENKLVFMSNGASGNYDLYLLPTLGEEKTIRLTDHEEKDSHPHWNPVADRLVFVSGRTGSADVYVMDLSSGKVSKLTNGHKTYLYPQWSPEGTRIVMIYGSNENHDIFLIDDINRPAETLKALTRWNYDDLRPVWSPDGKKIAFYSNYNPENNPKIWSIIVIDASGSDPVKGEGLAEKVVAKNVIPDIERGPAWMPDSKRIVYVKNSQHTYNPIYMIHIEDKKDLPINTQTRMNHDLACSPDGTLAFRAQVEQWDHIYIARLKE
ncbi:MAG: PD40 domain-containing protein [Desulfobacterales bacterium]|nr:MAG: PD40 domain-containing protein [Desulfobacterales bacterium]